MDQVVQIVASLSILVPFVLVQAKRTSPGSLVYLVPNVVGSAVLAVDAFLGRQWGFLLLEGVWALVSLVAVVRRPRRSAPDQPTSDVG